MMIRSHRGCILHRRSRSKTKAKWTFCIRAFRLELSSQSVMQAVPGGECYVVARPAVFATEVSKSQPSVNIRSCLACDLQAKGKAMHWQTLPTFNFEVHMHTRVPQSACNQMHKREDALAS